MRMSSDEYMMPDGKIIQVSPDQSPPDGSKLHNGYDYINQYWVHNGERDTRSLEELRAAVAKEESAARVGLMLRKNYDA